MSKKLTPETPAVPDTASPTQEHTYRVNAKIDAKIDDWIQKNQKNWDFINKQPIEWLRRKIVLNEVQQLERRERIETSVMKGINDNPERRQAYEVLMKDVPAELRDDVMVKMESTQWRAKNKTQAQTQQVGGVKVG